MKKLSNGLHVRRPGFNPITNKFLQSRPVAAFFKKVFDRKPDEFIGGEENPYLRRWFFIPHNRFFNIYFHEFNRSDNDRVLHDHPWMNLTIVIDGGYIEHDTAGRRYRRAGSVVFRRATEAHRISKAGKETARTIFITGPKVREWGFHCPEGWTHWCEYTKEA